MNAVTKLVEDGPTNLDSECQPFNRLVFFEILEGGLGGVPSGGHRHEAAAQQNAPNRSTRKSSIRPRFHHAATVPGSSRF